MPGLKPIQFLEVTKECRARNLLDTRKEAFRKGENYNLNILNEDIKKLIEIMKE